MLQMHAAGVVYSTEMLLQADGQIIMQKQCSNIKKTSHTGPAEAVTAYHKHGAKS